MFSHRTEWSLAQNQIARAVDEHRRCGRPLLDLTETNPTVVGLSIPHERIREALASPDVLMYSPEPMGLMSAREAVSEYHGRRVPPDAICLTASTSEAYSWLFKLLCDPGDDVLIPAPGYPLFDYLAAMEGAHLAPYRTRSWDDWSIDFDHLESQLGSRTRAIVVISPSNPTGAILHTGDLTRLAEICRRRGLAIICDEVFAEYALDRPDRVATLAGFDGAPTFVLSGLSKSCLLPQMKAGWIAVSGPSEERREALSRLEIVADSFLSVSTPTQRALPTFLALRQKVQAPLRNRMEANRRQLARALAGTSASVLPSDGGWSAVLRVAGTISDESWVTGLLEEEGVLVHPGFFFDFESPGYLVVSLIVSEGVMTEACTRIARHVARRSD